MRAGQTWLLDHAESIQENLLFFAKLLCVQHFEGFHHHDFTK
jgi:hypothetical protein